MRVFVLLLLVAVGIGYYGHSHGWFTTVSRDHGTTRSYEVVIDRDKIEQDRKEFVMNAEAELARLERRLDELQARAQKEGGEAKDEIRLMIADQREKARGMQHQLDDAKSTSADRWEEVKTKTKAAFDDVRDGFERAFSRFD